MFLLNSCTHICNVFMFFWLFGLLKCASLLTFCWPYWKHLNHSYTRVRLINSFPYTFCNFASVSARFVIHHLLLYFICFAFFSSSIYPSIIFLISLIHITHTLSLFLSFFLPQTSPLISSSFHSYIFHPFSLPFFFFILPLSSLPHFTHTYSTFSLSPTFFFLILPLSSLSPFTHTYSTFSLSPTFFFLILPLSSVSPFTHTYLTLSLTFFLPHSTPIISSSFHSYVFHSLSLSLLFPSSDYPSHLFLLSLIHIPPSRSPFFLLHSTPLISFSFHSYIFHTLSLSYPLFSSSVYPSHLFLISNIHILPSLSLPFYFPRLTPLISSSFHSFILLLIFQSFLYLFNSFAILRS
ncbi:unnamed protein product [Acanthosepion pharaonis]|uniref:Uncharacterized protein n=1 Tax=Acanthosepion pharaonis TaxID=158019 RepID=A0A812B527_ACAPH|nr:unnamed protein product [Sepia pharaonis]